MDKYHQHASTSGMNDQKLGILGTIIYLMLIGFAILCPPIGIFIIFAIVES